VTRKTVRRESEAAYGKTILGRSGTKTSIKEQESRRYICRNESNGKPVDGEEKKKMLTLSTMGKSWSRAKSNRVRMQKRAMGERIF